MKIQANTANIAPSTQPTQVVIESAAAVSNSSAGSPKIQASSGIKSLDSPGDTTKSEKERSEKKPEPVEKLSARQLIEIQGNPAATAENAAAVAHDLMPPKNPYPSVQELATIKKAQAMESAARARMQEGEYKGVDRRV